MFLLFSILPVRFGVGLTGSLMHTLGPVGEKYRIPGTYDNPFAISASLGGNHVVFPENINFAQKFSAIRDTVCQANIEAKVLHPSDNADQSTLEKTLLTLGVIAALKRHEGTCWFPELDALTQNTHTEPFVKDVYLSTFQTRPLANLNFSTVTKIAKSVINNYEENGYYLTNTKHLTNGLRDFETRLKQEVFFPDEKETLVLFLSTWAALQKYKRKDLSPTELGSSANPPHSYLKEMDIVREGRAFKYFENMMNMLHHIKDSSNKSLVFCNKNVHYLSLNKLDKLFFNTELIDQIKEELGIQTELKAFIASCAFMGAKYRSFAKKPQPNTDLVTAVDTLAKNFLESVTYQDLPGNFTKNESTMTQCAIEVINDFENNGNHLNFETHFINAMENFHRKMLTKDSKYENIFRTVERPELNQNIVAIFMSAWTAYQNFNPNPKPISNVEIEQF